MLLSPSACLHDARWIRRRKRPVNVARERPGPGGFAVVRDRQEPRAPLTAGKPTRRIADTIRNANQPQRTYLKDTYTDEPCRTGPGRQTNTTTGAVRGPLSPVAPPWKISCSSPGGQETSGSLSRRKGGRQLCQYPSVPAGRRAGLVRTGDRPTRNTPRRVFWKSRRRLDHRSGVPSLATSNIRPPVWGTGSRKDRRIPNASLMIRGFPQRPTGPKEEISINYAPLS